MALTLKAKALVEAAAFDGFSQTTPVRRIYNWRTEEVRYDTGIRQANQIMTRPIREWFVNWSLLDEDARDKLVEIFHAARGAYDSFLWLDDKEYLASSVSITTDGSDTTYQLKEVYYAGESYEWEENKHDIVPGDIYAPVVTHSVDGAQTEVAAAPGANEYTLDDTTGIMTFGVAPSAGTLTCTFQYYFRVQFADDSYEDIQLHTGPLYSRPNLHLLEVLPTT
jgi:uncharacterized protein (TIGR02217 family)